MPDIPVPSGTIPIVDQEGKPTPAFNQWTVLITRTDIIVGTGSPEGVIEATVGQEYMDSTGVTGSIKYIKRDADIAGDRTKGWILI